MDQRLKALADTGRIPHALVIDGGTKEERISIAKELASTFFCESDNKPCGTCNHCKRIAINSYPDVSFVERDPDKKMLSKAILNEMIADSYMLPHESDRKVYIIPEADTIDITTQNILLKTLEEPPKNVTFILLCPYHSIFLPTVLSRVAVFSLQDEETESKDEFSEETIEAAQKIATALSKKNEAELILCASAFDPSSDKKYALLPKALDCLELIIRDAIMVSVSKPVLFNQAAPQAHSLSVALSNEQLLNVLEALKTIRHATDIYSNKNLTVTRLPSLLMTAISTPSTGGNT